MASEQKTSGTINVILWIAQVILAVSFIWAASLKLFQHAQKLAEMWPWTAGNAGLVNLRAYWIYWLVLDWFYPRFCVSSQN